jgi:hypothetical protein
MRYFKQPYEDKEGTRLSWKRRQNDEANFGIFQPLEIEYTLNNKNGSIFYEFITLSNKSIVPIVYDYNLYSSSLVNKWDGKSLVVDKENNFIAANMMAVGSKNSDNQFSGVLLGDYKEHADSSVAALTGIYGFDRGQQAYAFKEDGTAFIGKAGSGRIWFDGNKGVIASGGWLDEDGDLRTNPF